MYILISINIEIQIRCISVSNPVFPSILPCASKGDEGDNSLSDSEGYLDGVAREGLPLGPHHLHRHAESDHEQSHRTCKKGTDGLSMMQHGIHGRVDFFSLVDGFAVKFISQSQSHKEQIQLKFYYLCAKVSRKHTGTTFKKKKLYPWI